MTSLTQWQQQVSNWHNHRKHDQVQELEKLVNEAPEDIWGPELSLEQSKALGCWLDSCARMYKHYLEQGEEEQAYGYLCLAQARLQHVVSRAEVDQNIRMCCCRKLEQITVLIIEFCQARSDLHWKRELSDQIESHVKFLTLFPLNEAPIPVLKPCSKKNTEA